MDQNKVIARVKDKEFTNADIDTFLNEMGPQRSMQFMDQDGRDRILSELVNHEILYLYAVDNNLEKDDVFQKELELAKVELLKQYAVSKLINGITVTDQEIEDHYNNNPQFFKNDESARAAHILVDTEEKAKEILAELLDGLDFQEAAKKYSTCSSSKNGGDLGYFGRGQMVPEFDVQCFEKLNPGDLSNPVKSQFGYHIIYVIDKKDAGMKTFDEVKEDIKPGLMATKQNEVYEAKTRELRDQYGAEFIK
ncbi:peptidyl-prolyl cis-trans isomerase C [Desulfonispora thiosulfatigenes DSM 11270]|uniref:Peptidyl-prolyl cis-trans isomerase C n=1 Tax=Desulfonispora thiosulfatigenes DSM 11270 TaxID=656914 RepID=A0A1W1V1U1_DESTI|nr:peptidylprolyl isomerase [Desulfonispora thiosulfatigenes]SMB87260.1 peptidyl-prolyl cis-trans isomerase C [Desulfonispora thiosulfatigenes DSM 11270]